MYMFLFIVKKKLIKIKIYLKIWTEFTETFRVIEMAVSEGLRCSLEGASVQQSQLQPSSSSSASLPPPSSAYKDITSVSAHQKTSDNGVDVVKSTDFEPHLGRCQCCRHQTAIDEASIPAAEFSTTAAATASVVLRRTSGKSSTPRPQCNATQLDRRASVTGNQGRDDGGLQEGPGLGPPPPSTAIRYSVRYDGWIAIGGGSRNGSSGAYSRYKTWPHQCEPISTCPDKPNELEDKCRDYSRYCYGRKIPNAMMAGNSIASRTASSENEEEKFDIKLLETSVKFADDKPLVCRCRNYDKDYENVDGDGAVCNEIVPSSWVGAGGQQCRHRSFPISASASSSFSCCNYPDQYYRNYDRPQDDAGWECQGQGQGQGQGRVTAPGATQALHHHNHVPSATPSSSCCQASYDRGWQRPEHTAAATQAAKQDDIFRNADEGSVCVGTVRALNGGGAYRVNNGPAMTSSGCYFRSYPEIGDSQGDLRHQQQQRLADCQFATSVSLYNVLNLKQFLAFCFLLSCRVDSGQRHYKSHCLTVSNNTMKKKV